MSAILQMRPDNKVDECFLVEIQGTFELTQEQIRLRGGDYRQGMHLGTFRVKSGDEVEIEMGSNTLQGKIEKLKKPLVIVKKTGDRKHFLRAGEAAKDQADAAEGRGAEAAGEAGKAKAAGTSTSTAAAATTVGQFGTLLGAGTRGSDGFGKLDFKSEVLEVEAVIRRKAVFTKRPSIHVPPELVQKPVLLKKKKK
mmetsp:Transcript_1938/g.4460  ORF Transcript_1938/g.4460 Transcript_1938/m.4460 type:complete len:196 (-) Transcript_1938:80-667(-)|eukprot:g9998.t1